MAALFHFDFGDLAAAAPGETFDFIDFGAMQLQAGRRRCDQEVPQGEVCAGTRVPGAEEDQLAEPVDRQIADSRASVVGALRRDVEPLLRARVRTIERRWRVLRLPNIGAGYRYRALTEVTHVARPTHGLTAVSVGGSSASVSASNLRGNFLKTWLRFWFGSADGEAHPLQIPAVQASAAVCLNTDPDASFRF